MIEIMMVGTKPSQLVPEEVHALFKAFKGADTSFTEPTTPEDYVQHVANCRRIKPTVVLLPSGFNLGITLQALKENFRHIIISAGNVLELRSVKPDFQPLLHPFEP